MMVFVRAVIIIASITVLLLMRNRFNKIMLFTTILITLFISIYPFENLFMSFKSAESAFKYYSNKGVMLKTFEASDSTIVVYGGNDYIDSVILPKKSNGWKLPWLWPNYEKKNISFSNGDNSYNIVYSRYFNSTEYFIIITTDKTTLSIEDSNDSEFEQFYSKNEMLNENWNYYITHISNLNNDYYIEINGDQYYLLK
jgi:hypothetical protein